jgi:hypothetical protein
MIIRRLRWSTSLYEYSRLNEGSFVTEEIWSWSSETMFWRSSIKGSTSVCSTGSKGRVGIDWKNAGGLSMFSHSSGVSFSQSSADLSESRIWSHALFNLPLYSATSVWVSEGMVYSVLGVNLDNFSLSIENSCLFVIVSPTKPLTSNSGDKVSSS